MIKNQQKSRRLTALVNKDEAGYALAFKDGDERRMKLAVDIENIIFDYFGIIAL